MGAKIMPAAGGGCIAFTCEHCFGQHFKPVLLSLLCAGQRNASKPVAAGYEVLDRIRMRSKTAQMLEGIRMPSPVPHLCTCCAPLQRCA